MPAMVVGQKMGANIVCNYRIFALATIGFAVFVEPAFAGSDGIFPAPGPIAGIGLPALAIVGVAYWVGRKVRRRKK
jgi:hypothetical protein